jgi:DNA-binding NtrC family response regulator
VQLVADRFAPRPDGCGIDLATGAPVLLRVGPSHGALEDTRWSLRCDALQRLRHARLAQLVDYGMIGEALRFEAWEEGGRWSGPRADQEHAMRIVSRLLAACGMTVGAPFALCSARRGLLVFPGEATGFPAASVQADSALPLAGRGVGTILRKEAGAIAELFESSEAARPGLVSLYGPPGSGKTVIALELARTARIKGFLPIAARLAPSLDVRDRYVCVIDDGGSGRGWMALLAASVRAPRGHVMIRTTIAETPAIDCVRLNRVSTGALVDSIRPPILESDLLARAERAARTAHGLPGPFVHQLWGRSVAAAPERPATLKRSRAAEQTAAYGRGGLATPPEGPGARVAWPVAEDLAALGHLVEDAVRLAAAGRQAHAIRRLRGAIGALSRRGDSAQAASAGVALARLLLTRGEPEAAQQALDAAAAHAVDAQREDLLIDIGVTSAEGWIDRARLDEAESVGAASLASARRVNDAARADAASLTVARCLFWRGRYADAKAAIERDELTTDEGRRIGVRRSCLAAKIAVGLRDFAAATRWAGVAWDAARTSGDHRALAAALYTKSFVHLRLGDLEAATGEARASIAAARAGHDPLRAIRARLILAEVDRREQRPAKAHALVARIALLARQRLTPLLRARCAAASQLLSPSTSKAAGTRAARANLAALALYCGDSDSSGRTATAWDAFSDEMADLIGTCQMAEDEATLLGDVCARVRRHLVAAGTAVVALERGRMVPVAADGHRIDPAVAARALDAGVAIEPRLVDERVEAVAPVQYGGSVVGAFVARWTPGTTSDRSRGVAVLRVAARAAAPAIAAWLARRTRTEPCPAPELMGAAPAMVALRRAIEHAAAAPFPVLVQGESGAGKELVARALHRLSPRRERALSAINCAALPDELIEAELFGHARGAFSGAVGERAGVFEGAHGGTLFLDEIGELSPRAQAKLLRVLQDGEVRRVGENLSRRIDVRIVAATNRNLPEEAAAGRFRNDLLYRIDVVRLSVPPLRERAEDIPPLAEHFWREASGRVGGRATLAPATIAALARYDWPGNVRELQNVLAALAVRCPKRGLVPPTALPPAVLRIDATAEACRLETARRTFDERFVRAALVRAGGHRSRAAEQLGVSRQGLTKLMRRLGILDRRAAVND